MKKGHGTEDVISL